MVTQRTERLARRMLLWAAIAVLGIVLLFMLKNTYTVYYSLTRATDERHNAESELKALVARKAELTASVAALSTQRGIEGEIRARYPFVKPGEEEFVLVGTGTSSVDSKGASRESIWDTIKGWFGW